MSEEWYSIAVREIERGAKTRRLTLWEQGFLYGSGGSQGIKKRVEMGLSLSEKQERSLLRLHEKMTEIKLRGVR